MKSAYTLPEAVIWLAEREIHIAPDSLRKYITDARYTPRLHAAKRGRDWVVAEAALAEWYKARRARVAAVGPRGKGTIRHGK